VPGKEDGLKSRAKTLARRVVAGEMKNVDLKRLSLWRGWKVSYSQKAQRLRRQKRRNKSSIAEGRKWKCKKQLTWVMLRKTRDCRTPGEKLKKREKSRGGNGVKRPPRPVLEKSVGCGKQKKREWMSRGRTKSKKGLWRGAHGSRTLLVWGGE